MPAAILGQGLTAVRNAVRDSLVTHVTITDDGAVFVATQTGINPTAGTTSTHASAATKTDVGTDGEDFTFVLDGSAFFTNKVINAIGVSRGTAVRQATGSGGTHTVQPSGSTSVGTDTLTRSTRPAGFGIGVIAGDTFTVGTRVTVQDAS